MSDRISADLPRPGHGVRNIADVLRHDGGFRDVHQRWQQLCAQNWGRDWGQVKLLTPNVMEMIAHSDVLATAANMLKARGEKAPGPDGKTLEALTRSQTFEMCRVLGKTIVAGTYRPGDEEVIWIKKASGQGYRPIVLMNVADRVVQKAAALVLWPMLDPLLDPLSFGGRPRRCREQAIAVAEQWTAGGHPVWLTHDLKDAYSHVSIPSLLQVFQKHLPCPKLNEFLKLILPTQDPKIGGIKQGGPLSSLALEVYLRHFLEKPWRNRADHLPFIRYADDLLVPAPDQAAAERADARLRELTTPCGMVLKATVDEACVDLRQAEAQWLGFRFHLDDARFRIEPGNRVLASLGQRFLLAHRKSRSTERARAIVPHWVAQLGPCYPNGPSVELIREALATAHEFGFEEMPPVDELVAAGKAANARYKRIRKATRKNSAFFVSGNERNRSRSK